MLVLTRKVGERICIGEGIVLTVVRIQGDRVRLGIEAPSDVEVHREEIYRRACAERAEGRPAPPLRRPAAGPGPAPGKG